MEERGVREEEREDENLFCCNGEELGQWEGAQVWEESSSDDYFPLVVRTCTSRSFLIWHCLYAIHCFLITSAAQCNKQENKASELRGEIDCFREGRCGRESNIRGEPGGTSCRIATVGQLGSRTWWKGGRKEAGVGLKVQHPSFTVNDPLKSFKWKDPLVT